MQRFFYGVGACLLMVLAVSCASTESQDRRRTVEEIFAEAMEAYNDGDWIDALAKFDIIKLQYPTSQFAADAQYYVAEVNYRRGEFILAAFNYSVVRRSFPTSPRAKESAFKIGTCYEELALPADRDQDYTQKAIAAYTEFQSIYPRDSLALVSLARIRSLRDRLAERYMVIAEHYQKTESRKSALIYYNLVLAEYPDSHYYEEAIVRKIRVLYDFARYDEARSAIALYRTTVPDPTMAAEVDELERSLP